VADGRARAGAPAGWRRPLAVAGFLALLASCGDAPATTTPPAPATTAPPATTTPPAPATTSATTPATVTGAVIAVDGDLAAVSSFTVLAETGDELTFSPSPDGDYAFPLPHLRDHLRSGEPVRVSYVDGGGTLIAVAVTDG